jgi:hypothetical protein
MVVRLEYSIEAQKLPYLKHYLPESMQYGVLRLLLGETIDYNFQRACVAEFIVLFFLLSYAVVR